MHLVILPIQITSRATLEVMQTSYYNFKLLLFCFPLYREVLQFQTQYIDRNYLTAPRSSLQRHALAGSHIHCTQFSDSSDQTAANVFILNMRTAYFPSQDKL